MTIRVTINGREIQLQEPMSLTEYLELKGLSGRRLAVAHNADVIPRERYGEVVIEDGDTLEIVRPVGGG